MPEHTMKIKCPRCEALNVVKNGKSRHGIQLYRCRACNRQFSFPLKTKVTGKIKTIVKSLLIDGVDIKVIAKATGVSVSWIYDCKRNGGDMILATSNKQAGTVGASFSGKNEGERA